MGVSTAGVSPEALLFLAKTYASRRVSAWTPATLHEWAQAMADHSAAAGADNVPTDPEWNLTPAGSRDVRYRKACDRRWWERKGKKILRREQSNADLLVKSVGHGTAHIYSGASADVWGKHCRDAADAYLSAAMVYNHATGFAIPLKDVAQTAETRSAKVHAVLTAMQKIASTSGDGAEWAMLTVTAPPKYHANPQSNKSCLVWTPEEDAAACASYMQSGWERIRAQLAKSGIKLTGVRAEEPQLDGTPHFHWVFWYPAGARAKVMSAVLTQFSDGLRVRAAYKAKSGGKLKFATPHVYKTLADFHAGRKIRDPGNFIAAQSQFDIGLKVTGERGKKGVDAASFVTYATKYITKYVSDDKKSPEMLKIEQHRQTYNIRAYSFFGLPGGAQTVWDLLRKIQLAPRSEHDKTWTNPALIARRICKFARICQHENAEGKSTGMGRFVNLLGGLTIAPTVNKYKVKPLYAPTRTRYGEAGSRITGVALLERTLVTGKKDTWTEVERYEFKQNDNEILPTLAADAVRATYKRAESGESSGFGIRAECAAASGRLVQLKISVTSAPGGLTPEQLAAVKAPIDRDVWISAAAASGKTSVMSARVAHLLASGVAADKIWCVSHTTDAAANLAARLPRGGVQTGTIHSFACKSCGFTAADSVNFDEMLSKSIEFAQFAQFGRRGAGKYVLVDEAQDLSPLQWAWIQAWGKWIFAVGDDRQAIYTSLGSVSMQAAAIAREKGMQLSLFSPGRLAYEPLSLSVNHRSAAEIVTFANAIAIDTAPSYATRAGGQVTVTKHAKASDEMAEILEWASATPNEAIKTRAILTRTRAERARIICELSMLVETYPAAGNVQVMTIHASKGLEFDAVLLACGQRKLCELEKDARNVWYVAVTRAREQLHISSVGELPEILATAIKSTTGREP